MTKEANPTTDIQRYFSSNENLIPSSIKFHIVVINAEESIEVLSNSEEQEPIIYMSSMSKPFIVAKAVEILLKNNVNLSEKYEFDIRKSALDSLIYKTYQEGPDSEHTFIQETLGKTTEEIKEGIDIKNVDVDLYNSDKLYRTIIRSKLREYLVTEGVTDIQLSINDLIRATLSFSNNQALADMRDLAIESENYKLGDFAQEVEEMVAELSNADITNIPFYVLGSKRTNILNLKPDYRNCANPKLLALAYRTLINKLLEEDSDSSNRIITALKNLEYEDVSISGDITGEYPEKSGWYENFSKEWDYAKTLHTQLIPGEANFITHISSIAQIGDKTVLYYIALPTKEEETKWKKTVVPNVKSFVRDHLKQFDLQP